MRHTNKQFIGVLNVWNTEQIKKHVETGKNCYNK